MMFFKLPGRSHSGPLPPLTSDELTLRDRLRGHVYRLAGEIGERNLWQYPALRATADYIGETFAQLGHAPELQTFQTAGAAVSNIQVELAGGDQRDQIIVVGAHYDSVLGCPGANDNATGTAALLELARLLGGRALERTVRLVAFVNEEPPFFQTENMGSRVYARRARERGDHIVGMFSLETIGYYSDRPGSQHYPLPFLFRLFYPNTADFIGFVANRSSRDLIRRATSSFRRQAAFPSQCVAAPEWITGVGWSDHWSFWKEGYPAVMVTDTALFRYAHYHTRDDTPEKVDYDRTARVVTGLARMIAELAGPAPAPYPVS